MKYLKWVSFVVLCSAITVSCGTTIESVKADIPDTKIDKVFVILDMGSKSNYFNVAVKEGLEKQLKERSVDVVVQLLTGLELDYDSLEQKAADQGSQYMLTLQLTAATIGQYNIQTAGVYDLNLYDLATKKRIWRAKAQMAGTAYGALYAGQFVKKIIDALTSDKLL